MGAADDDNADADGCETEESDDAGNEDVGGDVVIVDHEPVQADVEDYFATFDDGCGRSSVWQGERHAPWCEQN